MKHALVTGAGRGLGKGFVDYLLDEGFFVFAGVRNLKSENNPRENLQYLPLDVTDDTSINNAFESVQSKTQTLDVLINNAGVNKDSATNGHPEFVSSVNDIKREKLLEMFNLNTISPFMMIQKFLPLMKSDPAFIINISCCRASFHDEYENDNPNYGYAGSKVALNMFIYGLAKVLPNNIKTFAVHPGDVKTDMNQEGNQFPYDQARHIIGITKNWEDKFNGKFMRWSGQEYPL